MPHQCTNCERTFPDGSKEMLSGCPDCGGNKFQFKPSGAVELDDGPSESTSTTGGSSPAESSPADAPTSADEDDDRPSKEWVGVDRDESDRSGASETATTASASADDEIVEADDDIVEADDDIIEADEAVEPADGEDRAQADARRATVTEDEVADAAAAPADTDSRVIEPQDDEQPDISDLREELNEQFESIKILSPGTYELNLMELYDREEYIISLQEDGRYVIEVPDSWHGDDA